ncbi:FAD-dependent oxidoreductase [Patescibacteria group bacterium]|nr:FAD-dependent oxidoreductase [Patescibacteria group bacterium]
MRLTLTERREESPGVESFLFEPAGPLSWRAGQFLHYVLHHEPTDDRGSDRWFTVSSAPSEKHVMLTTRFTPEGGSTFKQALNNLKIGEQIEISDVDGDFVIDESGEPCVFIAGGIGVTPFRSILKELDSTKKKFDITLLYANRDESIPFKDELEAIARRNDGLKIQYVISPERIDEKRIRALIPGSEKPIFYISGPEPMVESMTATLTAMGVPKERLKQDWFPGYAADENQ